MIKFETTKKGAGVFHFAQLHGSGRSILRSSLKRLATGSKKGSSVLNSVSASHRFMRRRNRESENTDTETAVVVGLPGGWSAAYAPNTAANDLETLRGYYRLGTQRAGTVASPIPAAVVTLGAPGPVCGHARPTGTRYQILDGWCYELDAANRVTRAASPGPVLVTAGETRDHHMSEFVRFLAPAHNDDAGHIRAKQIGGSVDPLNLVPQAVETNRARSKDLTAPYDQRGCFYDAERAAVRLIQAGCAPHIVITIAYAAAPGAAGFEERPTRFHYDATATVPVATVCLVGDRDVQGAHGLTHTDAAHRYPTSGLVNYPLGCVNF